MWSWIRPRRFLVGLDIGKSSIKVVLLGSGRKGLVLKYAGLTELNPEGESAGPGAPNPLGAPMAIYEVFKERGLRGRKIAINFAGSNPVIRYLLIPKMPREELAEAVRWEAKKLVPHPIEDMVLDFLVLGDTQERDLKRTEVVVVAAERAAVVEQLESLRRVNLPVAAMDVNPLALFNAVKLNYREDLEDNLVFVDIGAGKMDINISKRGVLRFTRNVPLGGEEITQAVMRGLGVEREEAEMWKRQEGVSPSGGGSGGESSADPKARTGELVRREVDRMILETQRSIDYYRAQFREGSIKKIILMGGVSLMPGFPEYFSNYFEAKVVRDNPFARVRSDPKTFSDIELMAPRFSAGVGLALRPCGA